MAAPAVLTPRAVSVKEGGKSVCVCEGEGAFSMNNIRTYGQITYVVGSPLLLFLPGVTET